MAKNSSVRTSAPSRVRFILVEAELGDGEVGQITQAIQNALRGPTIQSPKKLIHSSTVASSASDADSEIDVEEFEEVENAEPEVISSKQRGPRKPPPTPDIVEIDMDTATSLKTFANGKDTKSQSKKYLTAAAWLKEHRGVGAITPDHVYTCFRFMDWSVGIPDFGQPLRNLKAKKYFTQNANGEYEINHLGLDFVKKLGGANGSG